MKISDYIVLSDALQSVDNLGTGTPIYINRIGSTGKIRTLKGGSNIAINVVGDEIFISTYIDPDTGTHNHDPADYRKSEVDIRLGGKSNAGHIHDDRYYTETEVDTLLSGKAATSHNHDSSYYTKSDVNVLGIST